jgi:hypothetical protein
MSSGALEARVPEFLMVDRDDLSIKGSVGKDSFSSEAHVVKAGQALASEVYQPMFQARPRTSDRRRSFAAKRSGVIASHTELGGGRVFFTLPTYGNCQYRYLKPLKA